MPASDEHALTADFLKVDVEGSERDVLLGGDWQRYRAKVVVLEAVAPLSGQPVWETWEPFLLAHGYRFALFDTLNRFCVAEEAPDAARLPRERAPWNVVTHMYEIGRAPENTRHPDHLPCARSHMASGRSRKIWIVISWPNCSSGDRRSSPTCLR